MEHFVAIACKAALPCRKLILECPFSLQSLNFKKFFQEREYFFLDFMAKNKVKR